jgi:hypothetical protein
MLAIIGLSHYLYNRHNLALIARFFSSDVVDGFQDIIKASELL